MLAGTRGISASAQEVLARGTDPVVKGALAGNESVTLEVLKELVTEGTEDAHVFASARDTVPAEVFDLLLKSPWASAREKLATRPDLTPGAVAVLSHDTDARVHFALMWNESVTFTDEFLVACLLGGGPGREYLRDRLSKAGADAEVTDILKHEWTGTLKELLETAREFTTTSA
jgi:hypothetical protein